MKILVITNLYPNKKERYKAAFNKQQIEELSKYHEIKVIAPIPFLKFSTKEVPHKDKVDGIEVYYPRYLVIPKIFRALYGVFYFLGILNCVKKIQHVFAFDLIFATWAYPDAFGAALSARILKKPLIIKVHGTDINVHAKYKLRRHMLRFAFNQAYKIIAVSQALKEDIKGLGIDESKIALIPNGVNDKIFKKMDKKTCQSRFSLSNDKKQVVFIGNLVPVKGVDSLIEALDDLPKDVCINIIGDGEIRNQLEEQVRKRKLEDQIYFHGRRPHHEIPYWLNAADVFCLPSRNEGCPNVVLEALACGVPVVASRVGGIPNIMPTGDFGKLVEPENPKELAQAIREVIDLESNGSAKHPKAKILSWYENGLEVRSILKEAFRNGK